MTPQELVAYQKTWAKKNPGRTNVDYERAEHPHPPLERQTAVLSFLNLVSHYGLHWRANVPAEACAVMNEINRVLSEKDKRHALGIPT